MTRNKPRLMALHCNTRGISFAVFDGESIYDWGIALASGDKNAMSLRKLGRLLDRFSPETLVHEEADARDARVERIVQLQRAIAQLCMVRNIDFHSYQWRDVKRCFGMPDTATRHDIAEAVSEQIDVLAPRLPSRRKFWQSEPRRMAIFSATAVAITHIASTR